MLELVRKIFQQAGYDIEIPFYPRVKEIKNAVEAVSDGIIPIHLEWPDDF